MDWYALPDEPIDIIMAEPPTSPVPPWVRVRVRPDFEPELDMTVIDGVRVTTVERTIVDLAEELDPFDIVDMIRAASRKGLLDVGKLEEVIGRVRHPRAVRVATTALELWRSGRDLPS